MDQDLDDLKVTRVTGKGSAVKDRFVWRRVVVEEMKRSRLVPVMPFHKRLGGEAFSPHTTQNDTTGQGPTRAVAPFSKVR